jgi:hypothetical protein
VRGTTDVASRRSLAHLWQRLIHLKVSRGTVRKEG